MILTQEQIEKRLASDRNIANKVDEAHNLPEVIIRDGKNHIGRPGSRNLSEEEKIAVAVIAKTLGNEAAAEFLNVSERTASHLRTGQTTLSNGADTQRFGHDSNLQQQISDRLEKSKLTIQERAAEKLLKSMGLIDDDKLANASVKELADVTNKMSQVMRNMAVSNRDNNANKGGVKIVLHQPRTAREDSFDVLEIGVG
jgi:hypothetical protein